MNNSSAIPAGRKFLAVMIMIIMAYAYWSFYQPTRKIHKKITTNQIVSVIMVYNDKPSREIKDNIKIEKMVKLYNEIKNEKTYAKKINPDETAYLKLKDAELFIATYNQQEVIIQYKSNNSNKQYLAESKDLVQLLKQI